MRILPRSRGFTLIELMVVVAIIAILAAIALPSYLNYVKRGYIVDATNQLSAMRAKMEQFYQDARQYTTTGVYTSPCSSTMPLAKNFTIACPAGTLTAATYIITATGTGPMLGFTYTVDQVNAQKSTALPSYWGAVTNACWITKKGGTCT